MSTRDLFFAVAFTFLVCVYAMTLVNTNRLNDIRRDVHDMCVAAEVCGEEAP